MSGVHSSVDDVPSLRGSASESESVIDASYLRARPVMEQQALVSLGFQAAQTRSRQPSDLLPFQLQFLPVRVQFRLVGVRASLVLADWLGARTTGVS